MSYLTRLNTLLTSTTTHYSSLRQTLLSTTSTSEADDTSLTDPSSSHISRVLRAYYTEKQRPFPEWLGPDPREAARREREREKEGQQGMVSKRPVGSLRSGSEVGGGSFRGGAGGGLGDIWGDGGGGSGNAGAGVENERSSLRRAPGVGVGARRPAVQGGSQSYSSGGGGGGGDGMYDPYNHQQQQQGGGGVANLNVRPLPSQRLGSYQNQSQGLVRDGGRSGSPVPPGSSGSGGGAAERLKQRLNRGGSGRSVGDGGGGGGGGGGGQGSYATQGLSGWQGRR